jgi:hypothetical protein
MVKRILQILVVVLFVAFLAIQFVRPDFTNPPIVAGQNLEANVNVPENVAAILKRSCADCHTNETVYPWYSNFQPAAWFLDAHIKDGRRELNFSEWATFSERKKKRKLEEVCEQIETREMPLPSYLWIHRDAALSDEEIKVLCDWAKAESAKITAN